MKKVIVILCTVSVFTLISNVAAQTDQEAFVFIENIYKEQIAENPLDYKPFALLAQMYSDQKDYEKAEQIYNDALKYHSSVAIMNHIVGNHYYFKARNLGEQKYFHQAIEYYLITAELEPQNAVMYNNIGLAYTRLNDYDQAITAFQKAIALDENYGCAHYNLGFSYCTIGDYPQAEKTLLKVIELNQYDVKAYNCLFNTYQKQDKFSSIIEYAQKAIKIMPNEGYFYDVLASSYGRQGNYAQAVDAYNQTIQLNLQNILTYGGLSLYCLYAKDYKQSEQAAIAGLEIDETQLWLKAYLAIALLFQDRSEEAESIFLEFAEKICFKEKTCNIMWLEEFDELEKAGVIPENQQEKVEKIRELLRGRSQNPVIKNIIFPITQRPLATSVCTVSDARVCHIMVFPNPATDHITIRGAAGASVTIFGVNGAVVRQQTHIGEEELISVSVWNAGLYLIVIQTGNERIVHKIVKQ